MHTLVHWAQAQLEPHHADDAAVHLGRQEHGGGDRESEDASCGWAWVIVTPGVAGKDGVAGHAWTVPIWKQGQFGGGGGGLPGEVRRWMGQCGGQGPLLHPR